MQYASSTSAEDSAHDKDEIYDSSQRLVSPNNGNNHNNSTEVTRKLTQSQDLGVDIRSLRSMDQSKREEFNTLVHIKHTGNIKDIMQAIKAQGAVRRPFHGSRSAEQITGYRGPDYWEEEPIKITVTNSITEFDGLAPGGLQIEK